MKKRIIPECNFKKESKYESGNPRFHKDGSEEHIIVGKAYEFKPSGTIVVCIDEDLETFTGIVVRRSIKKDSNNKRYKLGKVIKNLDSSNISWWKLKGGIPKLSEEIAVSV